MWSYSSGPGEQTQHRDDKQLSYFECERDCVYMFVCRYVCLPSPVSVECSSVS